MAGTQKVFISDLRRARYLRKTPPKRGVFDRFLVGGVTAAVDVPLRFHAKSQHIAMEHRTIYGEMLCDEIC
ncbi:hypothetical protein PPNSA23_28420 [Phyllobacterium phragmitis]|uniref:Uncharacterized protein n=1 Tax=Phyllobacterium phragmitis TaxID=2670329 RepID=A0ABQ0H1W1_9HYPH